MKAMLIAIFKAMKRKELGKPQVKTSSNSFRTNNVVQMDRRTEATASRKPTLHPAVAAPYTSKTSKTVDIINQNYQDCYELARQSCESAWPQPSLNTASPPDMSAVGEAETTKFASGGGSFDGGGSSGDWCSSSDTSSSSSSCDSSSSSGGDY